MIVTVTAKSLAAGEAREYNFSSIDRSEYSNLNVFLASKKLKIKEDVDTSKPANVDWGGGDEDEDDENSDEADGDYGETHRVPGCGELLVSHARRWREAKRE